MERSHDFAPHSAMMQQHPQGSMQSVTVRRLDEHCYNVECPTAPVRSPFHCFMLLQSGEVLVEIGDSQYLIKANECAVIPAGQVFSVKYYRQSKGYMGAFPAELYAGESNPLRQFDFLRIGSEPKITLPSPILDFATSVFERILYETRRPQCDVNVIKAYWGAFLSDLNQCLGDSRTADPDRISIARRFMDLVFAPGLRKLSVSGCAASLGITPNYLNKTVKKSTGKTPSQWIEEALITEAKIRMRTTSLSIAEIAEQLGIEDQSYFTRRFRLHEGITPTQYRNRKIESKKS